jgi:hypothetical protein
MGMGEKGRKRGMGGEMTQAMYVHVNKQIIIIKKTRFPYPYNNLPKNMSYVLEENL